MACLDSPRESEAVVCAGARLADELGAPLFVVHVVRATAGDADGRLSPALALAQRIGATVVRLTSTHAHEGFGVFAQREGITHAVFGPDAERVPIWRHSTVETFGEEQVSTLTAVLRPRTYMPGTAPASPMREWVAVVESPTSLRARAQRTRMLTVLAWLALLAVAGGAIVVLPAALSFVLAIAAAGWWCARIERAAS
jgi:K+-sensing histidine kinase KdpD